MATAAQKVSLTVESDKERILIGEQFRLTLQATMPREHIVDWPRVDSIPHFEILSASKLDSQPNGEELILKQTLIITSWDSGRWNIPSFSLEGARKTKPIAVDVVFSNFDPKQPYHDVKDIIEVQKPHKSVWYWYLIGAILLLLLLLLLFPGKKKKPEVKEFIPDEGIYKQSLARLEKLKQQGESDPKVFYTELVDIFRVYLHKRKGIQSFSKTTDDLGVQMGQLQLPNTIFQPLLQTLRLSDFVKFARFVPTKEENKTSIDIIRQSIVAIENAK